MQLTLLIIIRRIMLEIETRENVVQGVKCYVMTHGTGGAPFKC